MSEFRGKYLPDIFEAITYNMLGNLDPAAGKRVSVLFEDGDGRKLALFMPPEVAEELTRDLSQLMRDLSQRSRRSSGRGRRWFRAFRRSTTRQTRGNDATLSL